MILSTIFTAPNINPSTSSHVLLQHQQTTKFFWQNTSCIRKPQVISGGGGCTPRTLLLDPPLYLVILFYWFKLTWLYFQTVHQLLFFLCCCLDSVAWLNQTEPSSPYRLFLGVCHQFELEHFGKKCQNLCRKLKTILSEQLPYLSNVYKKQRDKKYIAN